MDAEQLIVRQMKRTNANLILAGFQLLEQVVYPLQNDEKIIVRDGETKLPTHRFDDFCNVICLR
jgi:hypothetical protein